MRKPVAIDLYAGGGGLTLGLKQAGFMVCAAVEFDTVACTTYVANNPGTVMFSSDIRKIAGSELVRTSPSNTIDLIAACPPCQGFSSLTAKYKRDDPRNELIFEFVRLVGEIEPKTFMMENVPGLALKGGVIFNTAIHDLREMGYYISYKVVDVADYGVPQRRRRLVVLGSKKNTIAVPDASHSRNPSRNKRPWVTVRDTICGLDKPITFDKKKVELITKANWHVVRNCKDITFERLRATRAGDTRYALPEGLRPKCHQGNQNGFSNVYGRMSWDEPSPTITGGCTTLSKGRFGHPSLLRTISVREAALLQTFPKSYRFQTTHIDKVCAMIGNALPPTFAKTMAVACLSAIKGR